MNFALCIAIVLAAEMMMHIIDGAYRLIMGRNRICLLGDLLWVFERMFMIVACGSAIILAIAFANWMEAIFVFLCLFPFLCELKSDLYKRREFINNTILNCFEHRNRSSMRIV